MATDFPTLVGRFIHHCGALEFFTNNAIKALASDAVLSAEAIKSPFFKRIHLLRRLLHARTELQDDDIDSLCNELDEVRQRRNVVAHNPIVSKEPDQTGSESILVVRHKPEGMISQEEMSREELASLVKQTNQLMTKFVRLFPSATKT